MKRFAPLVGAVVALLTLAHAGTGSFPWGLPIP